MALNNSRHAVMLQRRKQVADKRVMGLTQREIASFLRVSVGTVNRDLKAIHKEWQQAAQVTIADHRTKQLAELTLVKRWAWLNVDFKTVIAALRLEAYITGTLKAPGININIALVSQLCEVMESKGVNPSEVFNDMMQEYASRNHALKD